MNLHVKISNKPIRKLIQQLKKRFMTQNLFKEYVDNNEIKFTSGNIHVCRGR